jgi:hypothetical protein
MPKKKKQQQDEVVEVAGEPEQPVPPEPEATGPEHVPDIQHLPVNMRCAASIRTAIVRLRRALAIVTEPPASLSGNRYAIEYRVLGIDQHGDCVVVDHRDEAKDARILATNMLKHPDEHCPADRDGIVAVVVEEIRWRNDRMIPRERIVRTSGSQSALFMGGWTDK